MDNLRTKLLSLEWLLAYAHTLYKKKIELIKYKWFIVEIYKSYLCYNWKITSQKCTTLHYSQKKKAHFHKTIGLTLLNRIILNN